MIEMLTVHFATKQVQEFRLKLWTTKLNIVVNGDQNCAILNTFWRLKHKQLVLASGDRQEQTFVSSVFSQTQEQAGSVEIIPGWLEADIGYCMFNTILHWKHNNFRHVHFGTHSVDKDVTISREHYMCNLWLYITRHLLPWNWLRCDCFLQGHNFLGNCFLQGHNEWQKIIPPDKRKAFTFREKNVLFILDKNRQIIELHIECSSCLSNDNR